MKELKDIGEKEAKRGQVPIGTLENDFRNKVI